VSVAIDSPPPIPLRVLLVAENSSEIQGLATSLHDGGHEVIVAADASNAIRTARAVMPDAVVLDLRCVDDTQVIQDLHDLSAWRRPLLITIAPTTHAKNSTTGPDLHLATPVDPAFMRGVLGRFGRVLKEIETFDPKI
jgi:CheY-like chemotaxis protein